MNIYNLSLASTTSSYTENLPTILLDDHTQFNISVSDIFEKILPSYITIDWGDGTNETFDNNVYQKGIPKNVIGVYSPMLKDIYTHEYYPSSISLYKNMTLQVLIHYANGDDNLFVAPISIRTYDYFDSIGDIRLENVNILPVSGNPKEYQFSTSENQYLLEMRE